MFLPFQTNKVPMHIKNLLMQIFHFMWSFVMQGHAFPSKYEHNLSVKIWRVQDATLEIYKFAKGKNQTIWKVSPLKCYFQDNKGFLDGSVSDWFVLCSQSSEKNQLGKVIVAKYSIIKRIYWKINTG